jgi:hypothetical protein
MENIIRFASTRVIDTVSQQGQHRLIVSALRKLNCSRPSLRSTVPEIGSFKLKEAVNVSRLSKCVMASLLVSIDDEH